MRLLTPLWFVLFGLFHLWPIANGGLVLAVLALIIGIVGLIR